MPSVPPAPADAAVLDDPIELARYARSVRGEDGRALTESALQLGRVDCAACAGPIEAALRSVDGVVDARVSAASQRATVRWDPERTRLSELLGAVRAAGYDAVPDAAAPARALRRAEQRRALWRLFVAAFCAMQVMMLATPSYVAAGGDLADDLRRLLNWGQWVLTLPVMVFAAGPFFAGAWRAIRQRRVAMELPVALGLGVAFVASTGATFDPAGPFGHEVYFDSATMFVAVLLAARWLEMRVRHRSAESLEQRLAAMPATALRERAGGGVERVSVQRLAPGDVVRVPVGDAFPADGRLLEGRTGVDESLISGESAPVPKRIGDALVGGSVNRGAPVRMVVEHTGDDTRYAAIVAMMQRALAERPAAARLADRWARPFLVAVLLVAAASAAAWSLIDPSRAVAVAVAVLIVTCPCALSLAAPATLVAAAGGLARRGVLLQRLDALEPLARLRRLFVDKTGTLTDERLRVNAVHWLQAGPDEHREALRHAGALARWSSHPVAQAVAEAAPADASPPPLHEVAETAGVGLEATDTAGRRWRLAAGDDVSGARATLSCDGRALAAFGIEEPVRRGAAEALSTLRADGVGVTLLSGDRRERVRALAARLGIEEFHGAASPRDKVALVAAAQSSGGSGAPVGMIGDGINDAPVLARADVSIAMGGGAVLAQSQADAVVGSGDWADIVHARAVARRSLRIVRQNMIWAAAYNAACIPLAVAGWLPPWAAGLGMALSSLVVVLNAWRAGR